MPAWTNSYGYRIIKHPQTGRLLKAHRVIWQLANRRRIPDGWHIHHRDENKRNNHPDNLEAMPWPQHKRVHCGHRWVDELGWVKRCSRCGVERPEDDFPTKRYVDGVRMTRGNCRPCDRARVRQVKKMRAAISE